MAMFLDLYPSICQSHLVTPYLGRDSETAMVSRRFNCRYPARLCAMSDDFDGFSWPELFMPAMRFDWNVRYRPG